MQIIDANYAEIISNIQHARMTKQPLPQAVRVALMILFDTLKIEVRFCRLQWCQWPFVPKKDEHFYCCTKHKDDDHNKNLRD